MRFEIKMTAAALATPAVTRNGVNIPDSSSQNAISVHRELRVTMDFIGTYVSECQYF